ncbi:McrB family protein [Phaeodactylibacter xiamenensis]|uniref:McrB family protein n=1 Tax=Phaeodactylibacter xiamenensis TaxID=1524460 RepID=UPI003CCBBCA5
MNRFQARFFLEALDKANLKYSPVLVQRFLSSLLTKPFIILTGLSGSGKTKLAQAFVRWICANGPGSLSRARFNNGEELESQRVTYKVTQSDSISVALTQIDTKTKVTLPYELIYEWIDVIKENGFDPSIPTRTIRELVGARTNYSKQLNSFESHLKITAFELMSRKSVNPQSGSQYLVVSVGADWTNREPLLGFPNALEPGKYVKPDSGVLDLIIQANNQPDLPHFLILDEMNLSHVERYFADFLSVMESNEEILLHPGSTAENGVPAKLKVPPNLFIIGTVNIDETTNMFSPKVLDRANTIEFRVTQDEMESFLGNIKKINMDALTGKGAGMASSFLDMAANKDFATAETDVINPALVRFFGELKKTGAEFGYRSATEILRLIHQLTAIDDTMTTNQKIDIAIMQKLLPKLHGSRRKLCPVLETLGSFCISDDVKIIKDVFDNSDFDFNAKNVLYPLSLEKIARMYRGAIDNGFASFAEA